MVRILFLVLLIIITCQPIYALESISELNWNSRIILIQEYEEPEKVLHALKKYDPEIRDRDIYWFVFLEKRVESNFNGEIKEKFYKESLDKYFSDTETNVVLIGKDGGVKKKGKDLDLEGIFDLIDTMPMRQMEMEKSRNY